MEPWGDSSGVSLEPPKGFGWVIFALRLAGILIVILGLFLPLLILRLVGLKSLGQSVVRFACRATVFIMGIKFTTVGKRMKHAGAVVANHTSWLDIFTLNAAQKVYFVSKSEVVDWPVIGLLARGVGTVFIKRKRSEAARQKQIFFDRISMGDKLLFFPEGTSTDGQIVLPFKPTLFAAFFEPELAHLTWVQPVSVVYRAPENARDNFYGWWGGMGFADSLLMVLGQRKQGSVTIVFHEPLKVEDHKDRKALAKVAEEKVRSGFEFN